MDENSHERAYDVKPDKAKTQVDGGNTAKEPKEQVDDRNSYEQETREPDGSAEELYQLYQAVIQKEKELLMKGYEAQLKRNAQFIENPDDRKPSLYEAPTEEWARRIYDVIFDKEQATIVIEAERKRRREEEERKKMQEEERKKRQEDENRGDGGIKGLQEMKTQTSEEAVMKPEQPQQNETHEHEQVLGLTQLDEQLPTEVASPIPKPSRRKTSRLMSAVRRVARRCRKILSCCKKQTDE